MEQIEYLALDEIHPYKNNPRNNQGAIKYVANSIREFGFRNPIILDGSRVIVCGHTRYYAAKKMGLERVPCLIVRDLPPEKLKAYRLADNKVSEYSVWNESLLDLELSELRQFDVPMIEFGFEVPELDIGPGGERETKGDEGYYGDERERTDDGYNLGAFDPEDADGFYQMPRLKKCLHVPERLINFNEVLTSRDYNAGVHFFIDDYRFERVWNQPERYIGILKGFDCVFTPDFSLYLDMPEAMKIWNIYRSRLIGQMCQREGMNVIPTVSWADAESYDYCFDGLPAGGAVAVSTVGVMRDKEAERIFRDGMAAMIGKIEPGLILMYGKAIPEACFGVEYRSFDNENQKRLSAIGGNSRKGL